MADVTVFTLADRAFLPGLAGLVNSLRAARFDGSIVVGTPTPLSVLEGIAGVRQVVVDGQRWMGLIKPTLIQESPPGDFIFLDADIIVTDPEFVHRTTQLVKAGTVLALEGLVAPSDHRRIRWADRMGGPKPRRDAWGYYNSGFLAGCLPRDLVFLQTWNQAMDRLLPKSAAHFDDPDFHMPDQDVLNAILQSSDAPIVSLQFPDWWSAVALHNPFLHVGAMARTAFYHSIGAKPWNLRTVPPRIPSPYEALWYRHTALEPGPLRVSCEVPPSVRRWLAGSWSGRFTSRAKRLSQRLVGG